MGGSILWGKSAKRFFVRVWWEGKDERFWRSVAGEPMFDRRQAVSLLGKIQADITNGTFDPRTYRPDSPLSIAEFAKVWLNATSACDNTKKVYRNAISHVVGHFGAEFDIRNFTHSKLCLFEKSLSLSQDGKYNVLSALKTMLRFHKKDVPTFIMPEFPSLSKPAPEKTEYLTFDEQQTVLEAIPARHRPIFTVMMEYGLRPQEATALMWDCLTDNHVTFRRSHSEYKLREQTKTGAIREERITTRAEEAFRAARDYPVKGVWVFIKNDRGSHYDSKALNRIWREATEKTGLGIPLYEAVRHSLGCQLADAGYGIDFIQDVYKHTKIDTTRRYAKRKRSAIGDALENRGAVVPFSAGLVRENGSGK